MPTRRLTSSLRRTPGPPDSTVLALVRFSPTDGAGKALRSGREGRAVSAGEQIIARMHR